MAECETLPAPDQHVKEFELQRNLAGKQKDHTY